jgi:hypothetical protein
VTGLCAIGLCPDLGAQWLALSDQFWWLGFWPYVVGLVGAVLALWLLSLVRTDFGQTAEYGLAAAVLVGWSYYRGYQHEALVPRLPTLPQPPQAVVPPPRFVRRGVTR